MPIKVKPVAVLVNWMTRPKELTTCTVLLVEADSVISKKLEDMPIAEISTDLRRALQSLNRTLVGTEQAVKKLDTDVTPTMKATLEDTRRMLNSADRTLASDAPLQQDLRSSLRDLSKAAQSLRQLTDLLERQPESLVRGKKESSR